MGRHEPPTNRSFYLSMAASTLRFAIVVALVLGGVLVINQAFPEVSGGGGGGGAVPDPGGPIVTDSPEPSESESPDPPANTPSPTVAGTTIAVFNAAGVSGLAADTSAALVDEFGYEEVQEAADAPASSAVTRIFYRTNRDQIEAEALANSDFFRRISDSIVVAALEEGADVPRGAQLAIFLGTDYADVAPD
jgi:hypothetical protein